MSFCSKSSCNLSSEYNSTLLESNQMKDDISAFLKEKDLVMSGEEPFEDLPDHFSYYHSLETESPCYKKYNSNVLFLSARSSKRFNIDKAINALSKNQIQIFYEE